MGLLKKRKGEVLLIAVIIGMAICGMISLAIAKTFGLGTASVNLYSRNLHARQYALNIGEELSVLDFDSLTDSKTEVPVQIMDSDYYKMVGITSDFVNVPNSRTASVQVFHKDNLAEALSSTIVVKTSNAEKNVLYDTTGENEDNSMTEEAIYTTYLPQKEAITADGKVGSEINPVFVETDGKLKATEMIFSHEYNPNAKKAMVWNGNEFNYMDVNELAVPMGGSGTINTNSYIKFHNGLVLNFGHGAYFDNKPVPFKTYSSYHIATVYDIPIGIRYGKWRPDFISDKMNLYNGFVNSMYYFTVGGPIDEDGPNKPVQSTIVYIDSGRNNKTSYLDIIQTNPDGSQNITTHTCPVYGHEWGRGIAAKTIVAPENSVFKFRLYAADYYENGNVRFYNADDGWQDCSREKFNGYDEFTGYIKGYTQIYVDPSKLVGNPEWCTVKLEPVDNLPGVEYPSYIYVTYPDGQTSIGQGESFKVMKGSGVRFYIRCDIQHRLLGYYVNGVYTAHPYSTNYDNIGGSVDGLYFPVNTDMVFKAGGMEPTRMGQYDADED